jgi:hypothetical protein
MLRGITFFHSHGFTDYHIDPMGEGMKRRAFIALFSSAAATGWPGAGRAQQPPSPRRIGVLMLYPEKDPQGEPRANVFQRELEKAGWRIGGNLQIDFRWGTGNADWVRSAIMAMQRPMPHKNRLKPCPLFLSAAAILSATA